MKPFIHDDFLLSNEVAKKLYHEVASKLPIIDYHCHLDPKMIYENKPFRNLFDAWLSGDHYKWRLMRANGVMESHVTGDADEYEKFLKWAEVVPQLIGNPLFHWTHLELKRFFNIDTLLSLDTAKEIYEKTTDQFKVLTPRKMIEMSHVEVICTTDDPVDDLKYHTLLKEDMSFKTKVIPAFRPDKAVNIELSWFRDWVLELSKVSGVCITDLDSFKKAL